MIRLANALYAFKLPLACLALSTLLGGCTVVAVADAVASTAIGVTKGVVKTTGKVIGAAIPDGDDKDKKDEAAKKSEESEK